MEASNGMPLRLYAVKMGALALFMILDFVLLPSAMFGLMAFSKTSLVLLVCSLTLLLAVEAKILSRLEHIKV